MQKRIITISGVLGILVMAFFRPVTGVWATEMPKQEVISERSDTTTSFSERTREEPNKVFQLKPIIVTAHKTESDKQEVPASVAVYEGMVLEDIGINTLEDVANITPNVSFYRLDNRTTYLIYRGIGGLTNMNLVPNLNVDGVTLPYVATNMELDVARVEVLRGSQGSLYGRNTHAGIVNLITRDPGPNFEGYLNGRYESFNTKAFDMAFGGLVGGENGYRLALAYQSTDDYFENTFLDTDDGNNQEQFTARGKFLLSTSNAGTWIFGLMVDYFDGGFDNHAIGGGTKTTNNEPGYNDGSLFSPTLTWEKEFASSKLTSITNYSKSNFGFLQDWDFTPADVFSAEADLNYDVVTQEFRLEATRNGGMKWLLGAFLLGEHLDTETTVRIGEDGSLISMPANSFMGQTSTVKTFGSAFFGKVIYPLSRDIELTGSLRIDYEQKELDWKGSSSFGPDVSKKFDADWMAVSPSASAAWMLSDNQRIYATLSRGYKAGDYNNVQVDPAVVTEAVDPEYTLTYEAGYKGGLFDKRLELNLAFFYIDWTDMQVDTEVIVEGAPVYLKQNAAEAHTMGMEMEVRARPYKDLDIFFGAAYMFEYEFDDFPNSTIGDLSGKKLPNANEYTVNAGAIFRHTSGFFLSSDIAFNGPKYFDEANMMEQESYAVINAKVGYEVDSWSLYIYGRNLLDETYAVTRFDAALMAGQPQVFGLKVGKDF